LNHDIELPGADGAADADFPRMLFNGFLMIVDHARKYL
jgi:hypothetical protein